MEEVCDQTQAVSSPEPSAREASRQSATLLPIRRSIAVHLPSARSLEASARLGLSNIVRLEERMAATSRRLRPYLVSVVPIRFCFDFLKFKIVQKSDGKIVEFAEDAVIEWIVSQSVV